MWSTDDFALPKTDPEIYKKAAERIGRPVSEILFLDDNLLSQNGRARGDADRWCVRRKLTYL